MSRHRSSSGEILLKVGKEVAERALATAEESMRVPRLRCSDSGGCIRRKSVALEHDDMLEVVGKGARR